MERLTKPAVNKTGNKYVSAIGSGHGAWPRIIQRLAAYENTGLEPEEITASQTWIPVTERMPEHENPVMGWDAEFQAIRIVYRVYGQFFDNIDMSAVKVSHWMPLPEPPKED